MANLRGSQAALFQDSFVCIIWSEPIVSRSDPSCRVDAMTGKSVGSCGSRDYTARLRPMMIDSAGRQVRVS